MLDRDEISIGAETSTGVLDEARIATLSKHALSDLGQFVMTIRSADQNDRERAWLTRREPKVTTHDARAVVNRGCVDTLSNAQPELRAVQPHRSRKAASRKRGGERKEEAVEEKPQMITEQPERAGVAGQAGQHGEHIGSRVGRRSPRLLGASHLEERKRQSFVTRPHY